MRHVIRHICIMVVGGSIATAAAGQTVEQSHRTSVHNAILLEKQARRSRVAIEPLVGKKETYTVRQGDSLFRIARSHNLAASAVAWVNHLKGGRLKPGTKLLLPTLHILPRNPGSGIVLNVPERALYLFRDGEWKARYPVTVGKSDWQTALGEFKICEKLVNPPWRPTREMVAREGIPDEVVPAGPKNPLGDRWMGWSKPGFGFHSTNAPRSIGRVASHGCVRLYPESVHRLFAQVAVGTPIFSIYEPVVIGERDGVFYLSVCADIYHMGWTSLARVRKMLDHAGLLPLVDPMALTQIVAAQDGFPRAILGVEERLSVNGTAIAGPVRPNRVGGRWVVPAREAVKALGGKISPPAGGTIRITGNGHTLMLQPGQRLATLDDKRLALSVKPTVLHDTLMVPLYPLVQMFGAKVAAGKGAGVSLTTGQGVATVPVAALPPAQPPAVGTRR